MQIAPVEGHGGQRLAVQLGSYQRVHLGHVAAQPQQPAASIDLNGHPSQATSRDDDISATEHKAGSAMEPEGASRTM